MNLNLLPEIRQAVYNPDSGDSHLFRGEGVLQYLHIFFKKTRIWFVEEDKALL